jgi:hypothetical protein
MYKVFRLSAAGMAPTCPGSSSLPAPQHPHQPRPQSQLGTGQPHPPQHQLPHQPARA